MKRWQIMAVLYFVAGCGGFLAFWFLWINLRAQTQEAQRTIPVPMQWLGTAAVHGISASTLLLWFNEIAVRWREGKEDGKWFTERLLECGWILILGIFGAYYFAIRRVTRERP